MILLYTMSQYMIKRELFYSKRQNFHIIILKKKKKLDKCSDLDTLAILIHTDRIQFYVFTNSKNTYN